ncbi:MAG: archaemetzincin family Zn-dependent metalloprotease [Pseudomonadota bacterium]
MRPIGVVPFGEIPEIVPRAISANILGYLNIDTDITPPLEHPEYAYDKGRLQYNAGTILKVLESLPFHDYEKVIGVLDVDLFVPILTHVFGEARQGGKCALISLHRLKSHSDGSIPSEAIFLERAAKVALHELGHLFSLTHCMDRKCLMHFSGGLQDLDEAPLYFCRYCSIYFRDALSLTGGVRRNSRGKEDS